LRNNKKKRKTTIYLCNVDGGASANPDNKEQRPDDKDPRRQGGTTRNDPG